MCYQNLGKHLLILSIIFVSTLASAALSQKKVLKQLAEQQALQSKFSELQKEYKTLQIEVLQKETSLGLNERYKIENTEGHFFYYPSYWHYELSHGFHPSQDLISSLLYSGNRKFKVFVDSEGKISLTSKQLKTKAKIHLTKELKEKLKHRIEYLNSQLFTQNKSSFLGTSLAIF